MNTHARPPRPQIINVRGPAITRTCRPAMPCTCQARHASHMQGPPCPAHARARHAPHMTRRSQGNLPRARNARRSTRPDPARPRNCHNGPVVRTAARTIYLQSRQPSRQPSRLPICLPICLPAGPAMPERDERSRARHAQSHDHRGMHTPPAIAPSHCCSRRHTAIVTCIRCPASRPAIAAPVARPSRHAYIRRPPLRPDIAAPVTQPS